MTDLKTWLRQRAEQDDRLYERYGKPLEAEHKGEYVAIGDNGEIILGTDSMEVDLKALERFGSGRYCFRRIGYDAEFVWRQGRQSKAAATLTCKSVSRHAVSGTQFGPMSIRDSTVCLLSLGIRLPSWKPQTGQRWLAWLTGDTSRHRYTWAALPLSACTPDNLAAS